MTILPTERLNHRYCYAIREKTSRGYLNRYMVVLIFEKIKLPFEDRPRRWKLFEVDRHTRIGNSIDSNGKLIS